MPPDLPRGPADGRRDRWIVAAVVVVSALVFAYALLIAQAPLASFAVVAPLLFLYLAWRLVRAVERIAAALEE